MPEPPRSLDRNPAPAAARAPCLLSQHHLSLRFTSAFLPVLHEGARQERGLLLLAVPRAPDLFWVQCVGIDGSAHPYRRFSASTSSRYAVALLMVLSDTPTISARTS